MKKTAKERMAKRGDRFMVGYICAKNTIFGKAVTGFINGCDPMTRLQAEALLAVIPSDDCAIFELVPVKVNRESKK